MASAVFGGRDAIVSRLRAVANEIELTDRDTFFRVEIAVVMVDARHAEFALGVNAKLKAMEEAAVKALGTDSEGTAPNEE